MNTSTLKPSYGCWKCSSVKETPLSSSSAQLGFTLLAKQGPATAIQSNIVCTKTCSSVIDSLQAHLALKDAKTWLVHQMYSAVCSTVQQKGLVFCFGLTFFFFFFTSAMRPWISEYNQITCESLILIPFEAQKNVSVIFCVVLYDSLYRFLAFFYINIAVI